MTDFLALVAIIVSVVVGGGAIWVAIHLDRKRNPKREFTYSVEPAPLVNSRATGLDKLSVAYDGRTVIKPYLVTVSISSTGRADIPSANFDGGKPVRIDLQVPILAEVSQRANLDTVDGRLERAGASVIELAPTLLPKGYALRASFICEGAPNSTFKIPLHDITLRRDVPAAKLSSKATWLTVSVALLSAVAGLVASFLALLIR